MDGFPLAVLSSLPLHVFVLSPEGRFRYLNRTSPGRAPSDVLGRDIREFLAADDAKLFASSIKRAMQPGHTETFAAEVFDADGERRRYKYALASFSERGRVTGVVGWAFDLAGEGGRIPAKQAGALIKKLTPRQRAVLTFVAQGQSNRQIARKLGVSVRTVETHREQLSAKLGLRGVAALTRFALAARLV